MFRIINMRSPRMSALAVDAARVLGATIKVGRIRRRWTMAELAERAGVSRQTIIKVERGDPSVALGTFFEAATLVGVPLFEGDDTRQRHARLKETEIALLPSSVRRPQVRVDDDF